MPEYDFPLTCIYRIRTTLIWENTGQRKLVLCRDLRSENTNLKEKETLEVIILAIRCTFS